MKKLILLSGLLLFILACSNEDDEGTGENYPIFINLSFEMLNEDGSIPEDDSILISQRLFFENGQLVPVSSGQEDIVWNNLGKILNPSDSTDISLFGSFCSVCSPGKYAKEQIFFIQGNHIEQQEGIDKNEFYTLFKYPDNTMDTLKVETLMVLEPFNTEIKLFVNNEERNLQYASGLLYEYDIYTTIQKND